MSDERDTEFYSRHIDLDNTSGFIIKTPVILFKLVLSINRENPSQFQ